MVRLAILLITSLWLMAARTTSKTPLPVSVARFGSMSGPISPLTLKLVPNTPSTWLAIGTSALMLLKAEKAFWNVRFLMFRPKSNFGCARSRLL